LAKFRLTGPDGAQYDVTAPDSATEDEVLSRFQKEVGRAKPETPKQTYQREINTEAARRQKADGLEAVNPQQATIIDTLSFGASPQIAAAGRVGLRKLGSIFSGDNIDFPEEYGRERDVIRAQINQKRAEMGTPATLAMDVLGGAAAAPARGVGLLKEGVEQIPNAISYGRSLYNASKVGAGFGAAHGFNVETGDYGDKIASAVEGAVGGAIAGPIVKGAVDVGVAGLRGIRNMLASRRQARAERANATAEDFAATGTPEFPPAMAGTIGQGTAAGVAGTVMGGPVRTAARTSLDALEENVRRAIEAGGGGGTPADVGGRAQDFVRHQVAERSLPPDEVNAMSPLQLHQISGVPPAGDVPPPRVPPVQPREIHPVRAQDVVEEAVANTPAVPPKPVTDLESRYKAPTPEEIELAPEMVKKVQKASADVADVQRRLQAETQHRDEVQGGLLDELKAAGLGDVKILGNQYHFPRSDGRLGIMVDGNGKVHPTTPASPEEEALLRKVTGYLQNHHKPVNESITKLQSELESAQRERDIVQREMSDFRTSELPRLAEERRQAALKEAEAQNAAEASVATQKARQGARDRASADSVQEAMRRTELARAEETARAANATAERQRAANEAHAADLEAARAELGNPLPVLGHSREHTYQTEVDAAYAANRENAPDLRRNVLGRKENAERPAEHTETSLLLDQFGQEGRRRDLLPGYRNGGQFTPEGDIQPGLLSYMRERLGDRVADRIAAQAERRARGQLAPGMQGLQDLRTTIDREIARVRRPPPAGMGQHREDYGMLQRMRVAVDRDIEQFAAEAGRGGDIYRRQREQIDTANRQLEQELRPALKGVFGEKVDPVAALSELVSATQKGSEKSRTLEAFYKVVEDKGDRLRATSWLLNDMTRDGVAGFLKAYRNLSPDARRIMFRGESAALGEFLDRAARVGGKLERFAKTASDDYGADVSKYLRPGNIALGSVGYALGVPGILESVIGTAGLARVLTSKWYAGWLKSYPITREPLSPEVVRHMDRLYVLAAQSLGLDKEASRDLKNALTPAKAHALFAGENAQTADRGMLQNAKELERNDYKPEQIWKETGWFKGKDSVWRNEIDDSKARLTLPKSSGAKIETRLGAIIQHPDLFAAYPSLSNARVILHKGDTIPDGPAAQTVIKDGERPFLEIGAGEKNKGELTRSVLHEIQHLLESEEGFDYGDFGKRYDERQGEVEARNVEKRSGMSAAQRRGSFPPTTQDIAWPRINLSPERSWNTSVRVEGR
jgi:hypothetical protein